MNCPIEDWEANLTNELLDVDEKEKRRVRLEDSYSAVNYDRTYGSARGLQDKNEKDSAVTGRRRIKSTQAVRKTVE